MKFVIWTRSFDDSIGGNIALHYLCSRLNHIGEQAFVKRGRLQAQIEGMTFRERLWTLRTEFASAFLATYSTGPFDNPVARREDLAGAVAIYPETISGNPFRAEHVVRWLLHRPGHHTGQTDYGPDDLLFFYQDAFNDGPVSAPPGNRLTLTWINETYRQINKGARRGTAYLLRKGKGRPMVHDLADSICVDDMSHEERAAVFNRVTRFYSYDLYSMFGLYAAVCGCIPVVIPDPMLTKEAWTPDERDREGIAYGVDDVGWALATRNRLLAKINSVREEQDGQLRDFVRKCREAFDG